MKGNFRVSDVDFVVPCAWEGTRDQLHISDPHAVGHGHPGRLFSGTACLALAVAHEASRSRWEPPADLTWRFDAPLYIDDVVQWELEPGPGLATEVRISSGSGDVSAGTLAREASSHIELPSADRNAETLSRTLGEGDASLFGWWLAQDLGPVEVPGGLMPWPVLLLITSGFVANLSQFAERNISPVLRAYRWQFARALTTTETVLIELRTAQTRTSKTKPGWHVWTGYLNLQSQTHSDTVARSEFTILWEDLT